MKKEGRDKVAAAVRLQWLRELRGIVQSGKPTTETDKYKLGEPITLDRVNRKIIQLEKELAR